MAVELLKTAKKYHQSSDSAGLQTCLALSCEELQPEYKILCPLLTKWFQESLSKRSPAPSPL